ncbi:LacI family DNA-binding transcriptional regulator [Streptomyces griseorubiginosus]|uniref:LacI family DNA-binding transcriptional regulator n=1 Tax=Streptomyces griseorubiginosus TaxID=67304 RepID=UPI002E820E80|nr:LacI family DNA-binding transcriptional regulator [Streptomyces griseorubiginosus]WUB42783.1 LacI family transcriptional regulator [Streptomyces griseorubiginosus]WUB51302.1 LacI family transcriptional regulator [Streptomyces griseorubiginosus]
MPRVTSKDVAREAGVSQTTVSFVLNGRDEHGLSAETRQRVLETAKRLGYVPSGAGRALRKGRSNVVLCVVPDLPVAEAMEQFKLALGRSLGEAGYTCVYLHHAGTATPLAELWQHVQPAVVVAFGSLPPVDAQSLRRAEIPLIDGVFTPDGSNLTGLSQQDIGRLQIEHLAARGHRHIGYAALDDPRERPFCLPRLEGATQACRGLGLPAPQVVGMRYSRESARDAVVEWTRGATPVTAVAAFNDLIALAVLASCRTQSIAIPDDLALIGVDDLPVSSLAVPALTTIGMDLTAAAGNLTAGILATVGAPVPAAPSRPDVGDILALIQRETT